MIQVSNVGFIEMTEYLDILQILAFKTTNPSVLYYKS